MVRAINQLDARELPGIGALGMFFSPDSRWVGFFTATELKKVSITGGPADCTRRGHRSATRRKLERRQHDRVRDKRPENRSMARVGGRR